MSNQLKVAMIATIVSLRQRGWSQRRIARELGINRETVARYLRQLPTPANPAIAPSGSQDAEGASNPAIAPSGSLAAAAGVPPPVVQGHSQAGRLSDCEPWRATIQAKLDLGLSAKRIHQDLTSEHGFAGSYYSVRRFVGQLEVTQELPFRRMECGPGEEAQVDFGQGASLVLPDGARRRTHVLRISAP